MLPQDNGIKMKNNDLQGLIRISNIVGCDPRLVQGGGGNTSVKTEDGLQMYIKASGTALKNMSIRKGWRRLSVPSVLNIIKDRCLIGMDINTRETKMVQRLFDACDDNLPDQGRPSVESPLHAILDKFVIHLHALDILAFANAKNGKAEIMKLFKKEQYPPLWIPYADPGFALGRTVLRLVNAYQKQFGCKPQIMVMEKHGLVVAANSENQALTLVRKIIQKCQQRLCKNKNKTVSLKKPNSDIQKLAAAIQNTIASLTNKVIKTDYLWNSTIAQILGQKTPSRLIKAPALTPDEMGFVNSMMWVSETACSGLQYRIRQFYDKMNKMPSTFIIEGAGLLIAAEPHLVPIIRDIAQGSLYVRLHASRMGGINSLSNRQRRFIENWEAETFRVNLAAKGTLK